MDTFAGKQFSAFKTALADLAVETVAPIGAEMRRLTADPGYIDGVLNHGAQRARVLAEPVLREVYDVVGFIHP